MWPTKPKRFTIWPFTGKVCNLWVRGKGRALRLRRRGLWVMARRPAVVLPLGHQPPPVQTPSLSGDPQLPPTPGLVSLEGLTSPTQAWSLEAPLPLSSLWPFRAGPASRHVFYRQDFPHWPRPADSVPELLPAQPPFTAQAMELCGPEPGVPPSGPRFLHVLGK